MLPGLKIKGIGAGLLILGFLITKLFSGSKTKEGRVVNG